MRSVWQRMTTQIGLDNRPGFVREKSFAELAVLYANAAVVSASISCPEVFGYAATEAMTVGATPSGALLELLGVDRSVVAVAPTPVALTAVLEKALGDVGHREFPECKARVLARNSLSGECVGPRYDPLYEAASS